MFNKIRDLFKKKEPSFTEEQLARAAEAMDAMSKLDGKKGFAKGAVVEFKLFPDDLKLDKDGRYRVKTINNMPKLTKSELQVLRGTIRLVMMYDSAKFTDIAKNYPSQIQQHLQNLVKKNYLQRVKRGQYKLTFYK